MLQVTSKQKIPTFLLKLKTLLEDNQNSEILFWIDNEKIINVLNLDRFKKEVLPTYFKKNYYKTFLKQLNNYSFKTIKTNQNSMSIMHKYLNKQFNQIHLIKRRNSDLNNHVKEVTAEIKKMIQTQQNLQYQISFIQKQHSMIETNILNIMSIVQKNQEFFKMII